MAPRQSLRKGFRVRPYNRTVRATLHMGFIRALNAGYSTLKCRIPSGSLKSVHSDLKPRLNQGSSLRVLFST